MKPVTVLLGAASLLLAGCATPFRAPADVAHLVLERRDSPVVRVEKIWLDRAQGTLVVKGYVLKRLEADDTSRTHLDVILLDAEGRALRSVVARFEPRQIPRGHRVPASASYAVQLDPLPAGVARVLVAAHDSEHF